MLKFNTSCAVLAYLSSNLLNVVGLSLFRYCEVRLRVCDIVVKKFTFAISSPDEFLFFRFLIFFSMKTDVAKHESVTEKHLKPGTDPEVVAREGRMEAPGAKAQRSSAEGASQVESGLYNITLFHR